MAVCPVDTTTSKTLLIFTCILGDTTPVSNFSSLTRLRSHHWFDSAGAGGAGCDHFSGSCELL